MKRITSKAYFMQLNTIHGHTMAQGSSPRKQAERPQAPGAPAGAARTQQPSRRGRRGTLSTKPTLGASTRRRARHAPPGAGTHDPAATEARGDGGAEPT